MLLEILHEFPFHTRVCVKVCVCFVLHLIKVNRVQQGRRTELTLAHNSSPAIAHSANRWRSQLIRVLAERNGRIKASRHRPQSPSRSSWGTGLTGSAPCVSPYIIMKRCRGHFRNALIYHTEIRRKNNSRVMMWCWCTGGKKNSWTNPAWLRLQETLNHLKSFRHGIRFAYNTANIHKKMAKSNIVSFISVFGLYQILREIFVSLAAKRFTMFTRCFLSAV